MEAILIVLLVGLIIIGMGLLIINYLKFKEEKINNEQQFRILNASVQIDLNDVVLTFDSFIELELQEYLQININYKDITYITSDLEEAILRDVSKKIMEDISPYMINKLNLVYNIETEEDLARLITNKTYLRVLDYVTETNGIKEKIDKSLPNINMISQ